VNQKKWDELQKEFKTNFDAREEHERGVIKGAAVAEEAENHQQYGKFASMVLAMPKEQLGEFTKSAKEATQHNYDANQAGFEYTDDLMKLATATKTGYDVAAEQHWLGFDQIRGQLEEGHMAPGISTRITFPYSGNISFEQNSGKLTPKSEKYVKEKFVPMMAKSMEKYAGRHFTICIHAATNLNSHEVPDGFDSEEHQETEDFKDANGNTLQISKGMKELLEKRFTTMSQIIKNDVAKDAPNTKIEVQEEDGATGKTSKAEKAIKPGDISIPEPTDEMRHFGNTNSGLFPSGLILVIAEDKLHRDDYVPPAGSQMTETQIAEEQKQNPDAREDFSKTQCRIDDFKAYQNFGKYAEKSGQTMELAKLGLGNAEDQQDMNKDESLTGRETPAEFAAMYAKLDPQSDTALKDEITKVQEMHLGTKQLEEAGQ